jgi:16S rRNA (guanine(1405)-N(7))-methyltransferase
MAGDERLDELVAAVRASPRYRQVYEGLVRRIGAQELAKGRALKEAIKETRTQLHQVGGAYQGSTPNYGQLLAELDGLPDDLEDPALRSFCQRVLNLHASTRERWPYLPEFYRLLRARIGPVGSLLDLACGMNPLALPWMGFGDAVEYIAMDIYADMLGFIERFFRHLHLPGRVELVDLGARVPSDPVQVALLLKTLPCLDLMDKSAGARILDQVRADHLLVSFPACSLGGHQKGMAKNYSARFLQLVAGRVWRVEQWQVGQELVFWLAH